MKIIKAHSIEGNCQKLDGGSMFGNAPKALWSKWVNVDEHNRVLLACRALLLMLDDGRYILFETGIGNFFEPELQKRYGVVEAEHCLLRNLQEVGVQAEQIDIVVLSHLHFDHAGGLLSAWHPHKKPQLVFPNAQYWTGKEQWRRACSPHPRDRASYIPQLNLLLEESGRLYLLDEHTEHSLQPLVNFSFSHGHTPGLMLAHIAIASGPLVFCSDLVPGQHWVHIPITMGYDRYPELLINEKTELLNYLLAKKGILFFTHDIEVIAGKVCNEKGKFHVVPFSLDKIS